MKKPNSLKKILKEYDFTQDEFAQRMGIHQTMVSHIITGRRAMPADRAFQAEKVLGIPCEEFVPWLGDLKRMAVEKAKSEEPKP